MKKFYLILLALLLTISSMNNAQFKDWGSKFGIRYNQIFPENEFRNVGFGGNDDFSFDSYYFSFLLEALYAVEISDPLELEFNLGYGKYAGEAYCNDIDQGEYNTTLLPFDVRVKVNPWDLKNWNPFFYAGVGILHYISETKPAGLDCDFENDNGWAGLFPIGLGSEFAISDNLLIELSLGGTLSTSYELDGFKGNTEEVWDSYFNTSIGLLYINENCNTDNDKDGLTKCDEEKIGTDPENPDTDTDGLNDGEEFNLYKTNPLLADSDNDNLSDKDEVSIHKTNPLIIDTDSDELNDFDEVSKYKTIPNNADTDGEGLVDGEEVKIYNTNPLLVDSDGDKLNDSEEILAYKTNPLKKDTDNGSVEDFAEVNRGSNPLIASDDVLVIKIEKFVFEGITFGFDKTNISKESEIILAKALQILENHLNIQVEISGHTDNKGTIKYNQRLSDKRANVVKQWFVKNGINPERVSAIGYGMEKPIVPNSTRENRTKNRRCDIKQIE